MTRFLDQFFSFLANPPGSLAFSILSILILLSSILLLVLRTSSGNHTYSRRLAIGFGILLIIQVFFLWINFLGWLNLFNLRGVLPLIDRAFTLLVLVWLSWIWLFPETTHKGDRAAVISSILILSMLVIFFGFWMKQPNEIVFIYSLQDILWQTITLVLVILVIVFILIRKPTHYQFGLSTLIPAGLGHLIYLIVPMPIGYYPGVVRLYQLSIFLILLIFTGLERKKSKQGIDIGKSNTESELDQEPQGKDTALVISLPPIFSSTIIQEVSKDQTHQGRDSLIRALDTSNNPVNPDKIEQQLRMTLEELAFMQNELAEAKIKIEELGEKESTIPSVPEDQAQMMAAIAQELRQPISSIIGYTDLLMGESVGILGALQRKFLERVKFSTERVASLIEDLIQITTDETDRIIMNPQVIDLNNIIDNAIAYTSAQLREKNITMRLVIPESPPRIHIDGEALQQILIHLLQNAGAATLIEGTILLRVQIQTENDKDFLLIQVVDSGGGIPSKDLPRVFARRYRADNVLIQGLGDTGVGLSITKALAEAQLGRIWVETTLGIGSTISVLLPIVSAKSDETEQDTNN
jgi:signal transduction histidine kinase